VSYVNVVRAWQRRTSIHDKKDPLAIRDAKEEALRLQEAISAGFEDDDLNSDTAQVRHTIVAALLFFLSTHANGQGVDISFTVLYVCTFMVFSGEDKASGIKFCLVVYQRTG